MLKSNTIYISILISLFIFSCSSENPPSIAVDSDDSPPIYYKKSIHKHLATNQIQIDNYCSLLKSKKKKQFENHQILAH